MYLPLNLECIKNAAPRMLAVAVLRRGGPYLGQKWDTHLATALILGWQDGCTAPGQHIFTYAPLARRSSVPGAAMLLSSSISEDRLPQLSANLLLAAYDGAEPRRWLLPANPAVFISCAHKSCPHLLRPCRQPCTLNRPSCSEVECVACRSAQAGCLGPCVMEQL